MKIFSVVSLTLGLLTLQNIFTAQDASARDQIRIVGSSTVYPFSTTVAEQFGKSSGFKTPVVESTGTGGGVKLFCAGVDENTPDIVNASRRIKASEVAACASNGVSEISEIVIGYDGLVLANAKQGPSYQVTVEQMYRALAKTVPVNGKLIPNPYHKWSEISSSLPKETIVVFGPASNHGTRDALVDLVMNEACEKFPEIKSLSPDDKKVACAAIREDGAYIEVSDNYTLILQKLISQPHAVGILTFSYLDQNSDKIKGALVENKPATYENIANSSYVLSRPLYFYVKKAHVDKVIGLKDYIAEFTSQKAWGKDGYLADKGLIALPENIQSQEAAKAKSLVNLQLP